MYIRMPIQPISRVVERVCQRNVESERTGSKTRRDASQASETAPEVTSAQPQPQTSSSRMATTCAEGLFKFTGAYLPGYQASSAAVPEAAPEVAPEAPVETTPVETIPAPTESELLCFSSSSQDEAVSSPPPSPSITDALAAAAKMKQLLEVSEAHRRSLERDTGNLRLELEIALQRYNEMEAQRIQAVQAVTIHEDWGHSPVDSEKRMNNSAVDMYNHMKQYAAENLARALFSADAMKPLVAKSNAERQKLMQEVHSLRAALEDVFHKHPLLIDEVLLRHPVQPNSLAIPSVQDSTIVPFKQWGYSPLDAEKRITHSQHVHSKQVKKYATEQLARILSHEDDLKRRLAKSDAECTRLEKELCNWSNVGSNVELARSEAECRRLEDAAGNLRKALQDSLKNGIQHRAKEMQTWEQTDVPTPAPAPITAPAPATSSSSRWSSSSTSQPSPGERSMQVLETLHETQMSTGGKARESEYKPDSTWGRMMDAPLDQHSPPLGPQPAPLPAPEEPEKVDSFTPKEGWVLKLSKGGIRFNKRWFQVTGHFVVLSRDCEGSGNPKMKSMRHLSWEPLEYKHIQKLRFWLRSQATYAFEVKESKSDPDPWIIALESESWFDSWIAALGNAASRL